MQYWILLLALITFGCRSGSDVESQTGTSGTAGSGGEAAAGGDAGTGGDAGAGGTAGEAGSSGAAGEAGGGGAAGTGGDAGTGGESNAGGQAGIGGEAGAGGVMGPCAGVPEGTTLAEGTYGECVYADDCVQTGTQTRVDSVCREGVPIDLAVQTACSRVTDGTVVMQGSFGECTYADACVETGTKNRIDRVCQDGLFTDRTVTTEVGCDRDTDETVILRGDYGDCGYATECAQMGARRRTDRICEAGVEIDKVWSRAEGCTRDTDELVINVGEFGECTYADACVENGSKQRIDQVCRSGRITEYILTSTDGCVQVPDASCGPVTCTNDDQCADDERCLCSGYWFDRDGEFSCSDFDITPRICLPCAGREGPVCVYDSAPENGTTYDSLCEASDWPPYVLPGECPPQCAGRVDCPGACDLCIQGRCESQVDEDGVCDLF